MFPTSNSYGVELELSTFLVLAVWIDIRASFVPSFLFFRNLVFSVYLTLLSVNDISTSDNGFNPYSTKKSERIFALFVLLLWANFNPGWYIFQSLWVCEKKYPNICWMVRSILSDSLSFHDVLKFINSAKFENIC